MSLHHDSLILQLPISQDVANRWHTIAMTHLLIQNTTRYAAIDKPLKVTQLFSMLEGTQLFNMKFGTCPVPVDLLAVKSNSFAPPRPPDLDKDLFVKHLTFSLLDWRMHASEEVEAIMKNSAASDFSFSPAAPAPGNTTASSSPHADSVVNSSASIIRWDLFFKEADEELTKLIQTNPRKYEFRHPENVPSFRPVSFGVEGFASAVFWLAVIRQARAESKQNAHLNQAVAPQHRKRHRYDGEVGDVIWREALLEILKPASVDGVFGDVLAHATSPAAVSTTTASNNSVNNNNIINSNSAAAEKNRDVVSISKIVKRVGGKVDRDAAIVMKLLISGEDSETEKLQEKLQQIKKENNNSNNKNPSNSVAASGVSGGNLNPDSISIDDAMHLLCAKRLCDIDESLLEDMEKWCHRRVALWIMERFSPLDFPSSSSIAADKTRSQRQDPSRKYYRPYLLRSFFKIVSTAVARVLTRLFTTSCTGGDISQSDLWDKIRSNVKYQNGGDPQHQQHSLQNSPLNSPRNTPPASPQTADLSPKKKLSPTTKDFQQQQQKQNDHVNNTYTNNTSHTKNSHPHQLLKFDVPPEVVHAKAVQHNVEKILLETASLAPVSNKKNSTTAAAKKVQQQKQQHSVSQSRNNTQHHNQGDAFKEDLLLLHDANDEKQSPNTTARNRRRPHSAVSFLLQQQQQQNVTNSPTIPRRGLYIKNKKSTDSTAATTSAVTDQEKHDSDNVVTITNPNTTHISQTQSSLTQSSSVLLSNNNNNKNNNNNASPTKTTTATTSLLETSTTTAPFPPTTSPPSTTAAQLQLGNNKPHPPTTSREEIRIRQQMKEQLKHSLAAAAAARSSGNRPNIILTDNTRAVRRDVAQRLAAQRRTIALEEGEVEEFEDDNNNGENNNDNNNNHNKSERQNQELESFRNSRRHRTRYAGSDLQDKGIAIGDDSDYKIQLIRNSASVGLPPTSQIRDALRKLDTRTQDEIDAERVANELADARSMLLSIQRLGTSSSLSGGKGNAAAASTVDAVGGTGAATAGGTTNHQHYQNKLLQERALSARIKARAVIDGDRKALSAHFGDLRSVVSEMEKARTNQLLQLQYNSSSTAGKDEQNQKKKILLDQGQQENGHQQTPEVAVAVVRTKEEIEFIAKKAAAEKIKQLQINRPRSAFVNSSTTTSHNNSQQMIRLAIHGLSKCAEATLLDSEEIVGHVQPVKAPQRYVTLTPRASTSKEMNLKRWSIQKDLEGVLQRTARAENLAKEQEEEEATRQLLLHHFKRPLSDQGIADIQRSVSVAVDRARAESSKNKAERHLHRQRTLKNFISEVASLNLTEDAIPKRCTTGSRTQEYYNALHSCKERIDAELSERGFDYLIKERNKLRDLAMVIHRLMAIVRRNFAEHVAEFEEFEIKRKGRKNSAVKRAAEYL